MSIFVLQVKKPKNTLLMRIIIRILCLKSTFIQNLYHIFCIWFIFHDPRRNMIVSMHFRYFQVILQQILRDCVRSPEQIIVRHKIEKKLTVVIYKLREDVEFLCTSRAIQQNEKIFWNGNSVFLRFIDSCTRTHQITRVFIALLLLDWILTARYWLQSFKGFLLGSESSDKQYPKFSSWWYSYSVSENWFCRPFCHIWTDSALQQLLKCFFYLNQFIFHKYRWCITSKIWHSVYYSFGNCQHYKTLRKGIFVDDKEDWMSYLITRLEGKCISFYFIIL